MDNSTTACHCRLILEARFASGVVSPYEICSRSPYQRGFFLHNPSVGQVLSIQRITYWRITMFNRHKKHERSRTPMHCNHRIPANRSISYLCPHNEVHDFPPLFKVCAQLGRICVFGRSRGHPVTNKRLLQCPPFAPQESATYIYMRKHFGLPKKQNSNSRIGHGETASAWQWL